MIEYVNAHNKLAMKPYKFQLIDTMFRHIPFLGNTVRPAARLRGTSESVPDIFMNWNSL